MTFEPTPTSTPTPPAWSAADPEIIPVRPQPPRRRNRGATLLNVLLGIAAAVAVGGIAFAAGRATAPASAAGGPRTFGGPDVIGKNVTPGGSFAPGKGGLAAGPSIEGSVVAVDADSMTIETSSGATVEVSLDDSTTYHRQQDATADSVTPGTDVIVRLDGGRFGQGPAASGGPGGPGGTASDVTVVP